MGITDWFFSALRTSPNYRRKMMKIVILLFAVLATINAAALQNVKAEDKPAAVKAESAFGDKEKDEDIWGEKDEDIWGEKDEDIWGAEDEKKAETSFRGGIRNRG